MPPMSLVVVLVATLVLSVMPLQAQPQVGSSWYVSTTGNDTTGTGAIGAPFRTLAKAKTVVSPGDTVWLRAGTYSGVSNWPNGTSWNAPMRIRSYPGETVTMNGTGRPNEGPSYERQFLIIEGEGPYNGPPGSRTFKIDGCTLHPQMEVWSVRYRNLEIFNCLSAGAISAADDNEMYNLEVHDNGSNDLSHGIYTHMSNSIIDGGLWYNNSGYGIHTYNNQKTLGTCTQYVEKTSTTPDGCGLINNIIRNTKVYNNGKGCLVFNTGLDNQIYNNECSTSKGFSIAARNSFIYNNTLYNNPKSATGCNLAQLTLGSGCHNCIVRNNLIWGSSNAPICVDPAATNVIQSHNLTGNAGLDPLVENPATRDFRLKSGSAAINTGYALAGIVTTDIVRAARPVGGVWDIGAHEFGGVVSCSGDCEAPSIPTGLVATLNSSTIATLDWGDSTGTPSGYHVYQCQVAAGQTSCTPNALVDSPATSTAVRSSLTANATYQWFVTAVDVAGNESNPSGTVLLTMTVPPSDTTAPSVPAGLDCDAVASNRVNCSWTASTDNEGGAGVAGYDIRRCEGVACSPSTQITSTGETFFTDQALTASTVYGYDVRAFDAATTPNASAYSDNAYATTPAAASTPSIILLLNNTTTNTGTAGGTPNATSITFTTTSAQLAEGTHAAVFDASTDAISVASTNFTNPNNLTVVASFYADTAFSAGRYIIGAITSQWANRIQLAMSGDRLRLGLGSTSSLNPDVTGGALSLNTLYHAVLRLSNNTYNLRIFRDGTGQISNVSGTYTGLTAMPNVTIGNNGGPNTEGWRGSIDNVVIEEVVWTDAQVAAYCQAVVTSCDIPSEPTYDAVALVSGVQGDGANASANMNLTVTFGGTNGPDPTVCAPLSDWHLAYGTQRIDLSSCAINGTTGLFTVATPPPSTITVLTLTYLPNAQQITLTNDAVFPGGTAADLSQQQWWCRAPRPATKGFWFGRPNEACHVPSPGKLDVQLDLVWVGAGVSPVQNYSLFCDATPGTSPETAVRVGNAYHQFGTMPIRFAVQDLNSTLIADGAAVPISLPTIGGITAVAGGTMRRQDQAQIAPQMNQNERVEYRFALEVESGTSAGTWGCELRPTPSGEPLDSVTPALITIGPARFFMQ